MNTKLPLLPQYERKDLFAVRGKDVFSESISVDSRWFGWNLAVGRGGRARVDSTRGAVEVDTWLIEREEKRRCGGVPWFVNRKRDSGGDASLILVAVIRSALTPHPKGLLKSFIVWPPFSFSFFLEFASRVRVGNGDVAAFGLITISKEKQLRRDGSRERADVRRRPAGGQPRGQY
ncbi:hypothetical protein B296_00028891 [Ensete ventricosum]|uniref:Uncharacterized protein n=1 Tax=Ensete ventricosum TaxID=4639 RepID=A0A426ZTK3_ENSVE|nr:hypothetical protein B296_00028891 [Ensete ventricosum]